MEKKFFEAFPNLVLSGTVKDLFEEVVVEKITTSKRRDYLRIYISSQNLIEKEYIYAVQKEIKKQFFPNDSIEILLYERFLLSQAYTPEYIMQVYWESILLEIKEAEHMLFAMLKQARITFRDRNVMELNLEESVIAQSKEDELVRIMDKIFNERCGFRLKFGVS